MTYLPSEFEKLETLLGGVKILGKPITTYQDLIYLGRNGLTKQSLISLIAYTKSQGSVPIYDALEQYTTEKSLEGLVLEEKLPQAISEQIIEVALVFARAEEVFGDVSQAFKWLNTPNLPIGKPFELINSRFGIEVVMDELGRIEHGVPS